MSDARAELEPIERASRDEIEAFPMVRYRTRDLTALLPPTQSKASSGCQPMCTCWIPIRWNARWAKLAESSTSALADSR